MESEFYRSAFERAFEQGRTEGEQRIYKRTIARILHRRLGYLDDAVKARLEAETSLLVLDAWYFAALTLSDDERARWLAESIAKAHVLDRAAVT